MNIKSLINREESYDVEFKENVSGLKSEDLVAFANSENGGVILIGVKEDRAAGGRQRGQAIGTKISDGLKLSILDKAQSCRPAVNVEISIEEINELFIYKIYIPSGTTKPYCTESGVYKTRGDGRNQALYPNELLALFMEQEKNKFINNFKESTKSLESMLEDTKSSMLDVIEKMETSIESSLKSIYSSASSAEDNSSSIDTVVGRIDDTIDDLWNILAGTSYLLPRSESKINDILNALNIESTYDKDRILYVRESLLTAYKRMKYSDKMKDHLYNERKRALNKIFPNMKEDEMKLIYDNILHSEFSE